MRVDNGKPSGVSFPPVQNLTILVLNRDRWKEGKHLCSDSNVGFASDLHQIATIHLAF